MLLLVGAGLLIRSLQQLAAIHPGYDPVSRAGAAGDACPGQDAPTAIGGVATSWSASLRVAIPSVEAVATGSDVPLAGSNAIFYTAEGQPPVTAQNIPRAYVHRVSPSFFQTLRIRFLAGRTFTEQEMQDDSNAVIVSENVVKRFWPGQDPIGKRIKRGGIRSDSPWMTIVGVVNEMKYRGAARESHQ